MKGLIEKLEKYLENIKSDGECVNVNLDYAELSYLLSLAYAEKEYEKRMENFLYKSFDKLTK
jgi:hypothetical protein